MKKSLILLVLTCAICAAQGSPVSANGALERVITGAPFVADSSTEFVQTAADGSHVKHTSTAAVARDSRGRTRYSQNLSVLLSGEPRSITIIRDPGAGVRYLIDSNEKVARRETIPAAAAGGSSRAASAWTARDAAIRIARQSIVSLLSAHGAVAGHVVVTSLGERDIEGLAASGANARLELPSGTIGNEKPLTFTSEAWFSKDLEIVVMSKVSDPVQGETIFQLKQIRRVEPSSDLFEIPSGYRVSGSDQRK